jgi:hypothetical protein
MALDKNGQHPNAKRSRSSGTVPQGSLSCPLCGALTDIQGLSYDPKVGPPAGMPISQMVGPPSSGSTCPLCGSLMDLEGLGFDPKVGPEGGMTIADMLGPTRVRIKRIGQHFRKITNAKLKRFMARASDVDVAQLRAHIATLQDCISGLHLTAVLMVGAAEQMDDAAANLDDAWGDTPGNREEFDGLHEDLDALHRIAQAMAAVTEQIDDAVVGIGTIVDVGTSDTIVSAEQRKVRGALRQLRTVSADLAALKSAGQ